MSPTPSYHAQVLRLRKLAAVALARYPLRVERFRLLCHGENTTFRVRADGSDWLLRIHRLDYQSPAAIRGEVAWLAALRRDTDLGVPDPVPGRDGDFVQEVTHPALARSRSVVLFRWMPGTFYAKGLRPAHLRSVGVLTARLQEHARRWERSEDFQRARIDIQELIGPGALWTDPLATPELSGAQRDLFTRTRERLIAELDGLGTGPEVFGLIHADLHHGNYLFQSGRLSRSVGRGSGERVCAIDFDDTAFSYRVYDLAVTARALRSHARLPALREALLEGYASVRALSAPELAALDPLIVARGLCLLGWLNGRRDNPALSEIIPEAIAREERVARAYMER